MKDECETLNIRMRFQYSLNEVRKKERMTEGSERERE
jgi:hypothetical protein